jgi:hypothetical protein
MKQHIWLQIEGPNTVARTHKHYNTISPSMVAPERRVNKSTTENNVKGRCKVWKREVTHGLKDAEEQKHWI